MLSIAIKNTILIVLIILIIHFIIKNQLAVSSPKTHQQPPLAPKKDEKKESFGEVVFSDNVSEVVDKITNPISQTPKNDEEELLKYVLANETVNTQPGCPEIKTDIPSVDSLTTKRPKDVADSSQNLGDMMLIGSYEDESSLNGGSIFGGLQGFDENSVSYVSYTPYSV